MSSRFHYALQFVQKEEIFLFRSSSSFVNRCTLLEYMHLDAFHFGLFDTALFTFILFAACVCVCVSLLFARCVLRFFSFVAAFFSTYYYGFLILCVVRAAHGFSLLRYAML